MIMNEVIAYLEGQPLMLAAICAITGYLIGSVSSARIVYFLSTGKSKIEPFAEAIPGSDEKFESDLVSATLVNKKLGAKYGCLTALADMAKIALPMLLLKIFIDSQPYYLLFALFGVAGHNLPVYYRFRGGRGESPIIGSLLVISWSGYLVTNLASVVLGFITGSVLVMRWGAYVLMPFWFWYQFNDWRYVTFMLLLNLLFWLSMRKDLAKYQQLKRTRGKQFTEEEVSEFILMGRTPGRMLDKYSLNGLLRRMVGKQNGR
jgi:glycerol-3-phosphate acyltransferase PlsY